MLELKDVLGAIRGRDNAACEKAKARLEQLTMPHWALGRLMDLALDLAGITGDPAWSPARKAVVVLAADHGVAEEGVSKYPQEVTRQMVANICTGGAGINALADQAGCEVRVIDVGVASDTSGFETTGRLWRMPIAPGTRNMTQGPAMTREQAVAAVERGIEAARRLIDEEGVDLLGVGEMGIANTTASSAVIAALTGRAPAETVGPGTGLSAEQVRHKVAVVQRALEVNRPDSNDPLDVLAKVGGFEIGAIAGVVLGAAYYRRPVVIDGLIASTGALIAQRLAAAAADAMIAAHRSAEPGHRIVLEALGKEPLLDLGFRLGEGTGAALATNLVDAASRLLTEVRTFAEAAVSEAEA
ncbi:nicotinate-nucleotide--dimethylbenzimidazole phosphoribosyltransferase [Thermostilla marina]